MLDNIKYPVVINSMGSEVALSDINVGQAFLIYGDELAQRIRFDPCWFDKRDEKVYFVCLSSGNVRRDSCDTKVIPVNCEIKYDKIKEV